MELVCLKKLLAKEGRAAMLSGKNFRVRQVKKEIEVLLDKESTMWAQRSRVLWVKQEDRYTKYFHCCAIRKFRKNSMEGTRDESGIWRVKQEEIVVVMVNYYKLLFSSTEKSVPPCVLACVPTVISEEMNEGLCREFEACEMVTVLQQMAYLKAPSSNGTPPLFYQHFWGMEFQPRQRSGRNGNRWRTPPVGFMKINFNGAVFADTIMSKVGVVIRDDNGSILASCSKKISQSYKSNEIETTAGTTALSFVHKLGFRCAILEGDSLVLINALKT
ncbi:hypothetical protein SO802_009955 [Lithocarpus litseifolius]|uniref:RNase H type-1 domain-containing protein n=1 Tax=Lithocarpus litseifolius TaxID=425828 RepID=A0AAW2DFU2_9ROSI